MLPKCAMIGVAFALTIPSLALAQTPAGNPAPNPPADQSSDNGGFFGSVKSMFGRGEDHSCATKATTTNAAGDTIYVKRPGCP